MVTVNLIPVCNITDTTEVFLQPTPGSAAMDSAPATVASVDDLTLATAAPTREEESTEQRQATEEVKKEGVKFECLRKTVTRIIRLQDILTC